MEQREEAIRRWFEMWLLGRDLGIGSLFSPDARYIESWGPAYQGVHRIAHWFHEWNTRGSVTEWTILQFFHKPEETAVTWRFRAEMNDGTVQAFDGVSLVRWDAEGRICFLQEFGCNTNTYDPYENGPVPQFRSEAALWF